MRVFENLDEFRTFRRAWRQTNPTKKVGLIPTMGALHAGHFQLVVQGQKANDICAVSLFVNPTQFNDPEDFKKYPSNLSEDLHELKRLQVDWVLLPKAEQIYPDGYRFKVSESRDSLPLCGSHRPGHFEGVLTVVLKLLQLLQADHAYFGEKDYQQFKLIRDMAEAFFLDTKIVPVATVREADGLAMSSRNQRLNSEMRKQAAKLYEFLKSPESNEVIKSKLEAEGFNVDYISQAWGRRFVAAQLGGVRLIDNIAVTEILE